MTNFTSNTYQMRREIFTFLNKISRHLSKPDRKFTADMAYGMLSSGSCLLTDIVDQFHGSSRKVNFVERLNWHLNRGIPAKALKSVLLAQFIPASNEPSAVLARAFGECREGHIPRCSAAL